MMLFRMKQSHQLMSAELMHSSNILLHLLDLRCCFELCYTHQRLFNKIFISIWLYKYVLWAFLPSAHWELPSGCTLTANCPVYELKLVLVPPEGDLGIEYSASARSAARLSTISFGNLSGSPGWRGINFCRRWKPCSRVGSVKALKIQF